MKVIKIVLALLFILFAAVQYNDPDPWLWIAIYGLTAGLFIANISGWYNKRVLWVLFVVGVAYSLTYIGGVIDYIGMGEPGAIIETMKAEKPYIEETREFFGMWIVIAAIGFLIKKGSN